MTQYTHCQTNQLLMGSKKKRSAFSWAKKTTGQVGITQFTHCQSKANQPNGRFLECTEVNGSNGANLFLFYRTKT